MLTITQGYIEDKKKTAIKDEDAVMYYSDQKMVLLETQRSLLSVIQYWKLSCVPLDRSCLA